MHTDSCDVVDSDELRKSKDELDTSRTAILDLIDTLDQKKSEAILRTFKGIAKHFTTVFSELVPLGRGTLQMKTKMVCCH